MDSLKGFALLVWISFGLGSVLYAVLATEYDRMLIFKEPIPDKALRGHVIETDLVPDEGSCRVKCYMEPNCVSINVGPATEGQLTCELNNHTDESPSHSSLEEETDYIHYAVENFCHGDPCPVNVSFCQVGFTSKGYRCVCHEGYISTGDHRQCEECHGVIYNGACYTLFTDPVPWKEANATCEALNTHLVKIESEDENTFIRNNVLEKEGPWIGLNDLDNEGVFVWYDGTNLTGYINWLGDNPNNGVGNADGNEEEDCVSFLGPKWIDIDCETHMGYVCEKEAR